MSTGDRGWQRAALVAFALTLICSAPASHPKRAWAAIGDECVDAGGCGPGELCVSPAPGALSKICTTRCNPSDSICPEPLACVQIGGLLLCAQDTPRAALGEPCSERVLCDEGLSCLMEGEASYCTVACVLPGSCPVGLECRLSAQGGGAQLCALVGEVASAGNPCVTLGCAEGLECVDPEGERALPYCSYSCEGRACPALMTCDRSGESPQCRFTAPVFREGGECVLEGRAADPLTLGCGPDLSCEPDGLLGACAALCGPDRPCTGGRGCVTPASGPREDGRGACVEGRFDEPALRALEPQGEEGGSPFTPPPPPPPTDDAAPPAPAEGASCASGGLGAGRGGLLLALLAALLLARAPLQRSLQRSLSRSR